MFAVEPGQLGPQLEQLGLALPPLRGVVIVSPHWRTRVMRVSASAQPPTINDYNGFPPVLYTLRYPAPGDPVLAGEVRQQLMSAGLTVNLDETRGRDHGAWVPLRYLLPEANVPVLQVSLPFDANVASALALGKALAPLRDQGLLIIGSGGTTHNLREYRHDGEGIPEYVTTFTLWIRDVLQRGDTNALLEYRARAPHAERAHPTQDHILPLFVAYGARGNDTAPGVLRGGVHYGMLSMESYAWGSPSVD